MSEEEIFIQEKGEPENNNRRARETGRDEVEACVSNIDERTEIMKCVNMVLIDNSFRASFTNQNIRGMMAHLLSMIGSKEWDSIVKGSKEHKTGTFHLTILYIYNILAVYIKNGGDFVGEVEKTMFFKLKKEIDKVA